MPRLERAANGYAVTATTLKKTMRNDDEDAAPASARADRQQDFLAERVFKFFEIQRGFALVAQHLEHRGTALFGDLYPATLNTHNMHLQRFDQKVPVVAAIRTGQRHV